LIGLLAMLSGCGSSSPTTTLSVACNGELNLAGAQSVEVTADPPTQSAIIHFPDPVNPGHTGTITVPFGKRCTVTPVSTTAK